MTSRNRLPARLAVLLCALVAAAGCTGADHSATATATATATAASAATATAPRPSAPRPSAPRTTAATPAPAGTWVPTDPALADVCRTRLPAQALDTLGLIARGGPYPYRSDGIVFENRENRLPRKASGYYHEYTVVTPGSADRGARRVVTGGSGEQYWTADHYDSFQEIDVRC
ncbi:ribonuclease domain-containing protein [Kitasatospora sp. CM 4170]|uniref:Ribonuclease domain-containing protein n=1 Tax=Kitasatospora aburaviensis TaxID=67265 RepID=A0ABW1ERC4_9ACTN|nr:ribonuclease domain-containing protein [Kitasatospora sp. CM 4170]WNM45688.1 ribonuclease domain-containing protein [Kitasatospora sp. CM 4170]